MLPTKCLAKFLCLGCVFATIVTRNGVVLSAVDNRLGAHTICVVFEGIGNHLLFPRSQFVDVRHTLVGLFNLVPMDGNVLMVGVHILIVIEHHLELIDCVLFRTATLNNYRPRELVVCHSYLLLLSKLRLGFRSTDHQ